MAYDVMDYVKAYDVMNLVKACRLFSVKPQPAHVQIVNWAIMSKLRWKLIKHFRAQEWISKCCLQILCHFCEALLC